MAYFEESYSKFLKIEAYFKFLLSLVTMSWLRKIIRIPSGFLSLVVFWLLVICFNRFIHSWGNSTVFGLSGILFVAHGQILSKMLSVLINKSDVKEIFEWFKGLLQNTGNDLLDNVVAVEMNKIYTIAIIVLRIFSVSLCTVPLSVTIYIQVSDNDFYQYPSFIQEWSKYRVTHTFVFQSTVLLALTSECFVLFIGINNIGVLNILTKLCQALNKPHIIAEHNVGNLLRAMVKLHAELIEHLNRFYDIFYFGFIIQLATSVLILLLNFHLILHNNEQFIFYVLLASVMLQFTPFCVFGDIIHGKTERIFTDLYQTLWYEMKLEDQKMILMMMIISQNTYGIKAAGMYDVNLIMLVQIVKLSFSYCMILYAFM
ncbi:hypothetical protein DMENIID0001_098690 [Sergentomyia squamirostris]